MAGANAGDRAASPACPWKRPKVSDDDNREGASARVSSSALASAALNSDDRPHFASLWGQVSRHYEIALD